MHYVFLSNNVVTDQTQIDPYSVFDYEYASQFIEAPDEVTFNWTLVDGNWVPPINPLPDVKTQNKMQAESLLQATDWTATVDISDPAISNPYLMNQNEFLSFRSQVRAVAVTPPDTPVVFPEIPKEIWSNQ